MINNAQVTFSNGRILAGPDAVQDSFGVPQLVVLDEKGDLLATVTAEEAAAQPEEAVTSLMDALTMGRPAAAAEWQQDNWSGECVLTTEDDLQLRISAAGESVTYLRLCDQQGREYVYWTSDEWMEGPEEVLGAFLGAAQGGPLDFAYLDDQD